MSVLLRLEGITKAFGGVQALRGASLTLRAGQVHALVGENGAGKSTLIKIITGAHQPDAGVLEILGQRIEANDPNLARSLGVAVIYQQPALFGDLSVAENLAIGRDRRPWWKPISWSQRRSQAQALLARVGADIDPDCEASELSMPQQQLVEIARALGANAKIVIMDEPTASLSDREVESLFRVIGELRSQGVGILYISHRLDELGRIADEVSVLRDGAYLGTHPMTNVTRSDLIRMMVGRELSSVYPKSEAAIGAPALELIGVSCSVAGVHDINLTVRSGEIVALAGLVGAGRTELAGVLFGLTPADAGTIRIAGKSVTPQNPQQAVELGLAYVPEDRRRHGVILDMPIAQNTSLAVLSQVASRGFIRFLAERNLANDYVARLGIKTASIQTPAGNLSGGNQQKVALSRWLATQPKVLILDEPTQGIDVGAKAEIHRLMVELAKQGMAILMISSELPEALGMGDRIAVMSHGRLVGVLNRNEANQEKVLDLALKLPA